jgi:hypothetical protein
LSARRIRTLLTAAAFVAAVASDARPQTRPAPLELLDVPYLPQSEALCGGAAAAMVMRYWGARGVYAESFSDLVRGDAGIRGEDLLRALAQRGWTARSFRGDPIVVREQLARRRPIVALLEDRPGRFHYVVLVAWPDGRVLLHDPARAPFRVLTDAEFIRAWERSGFWTLLVLPESPEKTESTEKTELPEKAEKPEKPEKTEKPGGACTGMVEEGVRLAGVGDRAAARRLFELAAAACPQASAPWREMAGLHALGREWRDAADVARHAVALDPNDGHAWRILATATYLGGDPEGALEAWNRIGEPRVDIVNIRGLERTRFDVVSSAAAIAPQALLTAEALARARRRVAEIPSLQTSRVLFQPAESGAAEVDVVVFERPMLPIDRPSLAAIGIRALAEREASVAIASPTGAGEAVRVAWRWWNERPRISLGFSTPVRNGAVLHIEAFGERQTYGPETARVVERRRGASLALADWPRADTRWELRAGADRFEGGGRFGSMGAGIERRFAGDTLSVSSRGEAWFGTATTWTARAGVDWRSTRSREGNQAIATAGLIVTGNRSPLALWSGAGTGPRADALLRAHPVLDDGRVDGAVFGRRLLYAGVEWRRWLPPWKRVLRIAPAIFVDAARAVDGASFSDSRGHVDVGVGIRFVVPGAGVVGIDVGRGLRDGRTALSIGWRY